MSKLSLENVYRALAAATDVVVSHREKNEVDFIRSWDYLNDCAATPEIIASMAHEILNHRALAEAEYAQRVWDRGVGNIPVKTVALSGVTSMTTSGKDPIEGFRTEPRETENDA